MGVRGLDRQAGRWALDLGKHYVTVGAAPYSKIGEKNDSGLIRGHSHPQLSLEQPARPMSPWQQATEAISCPVCQEGNGLEG